jgi:hypothetical protein
MKMLVVVPNSLRSAGQCLRKALVRPPVRLSNPDFMRAWSAVAYLFPGLHPDGYEEDGSGWPRVLKPFAAEAWRRNESGALKDDEMYPSNASWAGMFDRFESFTEEDRARRFEIAAGYGELTDG